MANLHILSDCGDAASLAWRLTRDGNSVTWWTREPGSRQMLRGLVPMDSSSGRRTVIVDGTGVKTSAMPRIGSNTLETWETVRGEGAAAMIEHGLAVPETVEFTNLNKAIGFLADSDGEWYFKPDGDAPKSMTRKGDTDWLVRFLTWARPQLAKVPRFILQRPVAGEPVEIDVAVWLNAQGPVAYEYCIEEKKFLADNVGPATGCQANILWDAREDDKLVKQTIGLFVDTLMESGYCGLASVNVLIPPDLIAGGYGLEFTMRLGYDSTQAFMCLFDDTLGDQLDLLARGELLTFHRKHNVAAMTLRVSTPPQPQEASKDHKDFAGLPLPPDLLDDPGFMPDDIALRDGKPVLATGSGFVGTYGTTGTTAIGMRRNLLRRAKAANIPDAMYRTDPVSRFESVLAFLRKHHLAHDPFEP